MHQKLQNLPVWKQHLYSFLFSSICMGIAMTAAQLCHALLLQSPFVILLFLLLAVIAISYCTAKYEYGISCCLLSALWFYRNSLPADCPAGILQTSCLIAFLVMAAISVFTCILSSQLTSLKDILDERQKLLSESEAEKMRANLLRSISHDLRTPLAVIIGDSSLYLEDNGKLSESEKTKLLTNISEEANWLLNVVENLLAITRIKEGSFSIVTHEEALEEVIAEALQKFKKPYPDVRVIVKIPENYITLPMDAMLIEQVIVNLLSNAAIHSESQKAIELTVRDTPHAISLSVKDYGVGISAQMLEHLFDGISHPASRFGNSPKSMGIGLSICQTIINAHHGTILARNHEAGAEFVFTLPKN